MPICYDLPSRSWHLRTAHTSYVLVSDAGALALLHWGKALSDDDVTTLATRPHAPQLESSFRQRGQDEIAGYGGPDLRTPSLLVEFADGSRTLDLVVGSYVVEDDTLDIELADPAYPLQILLHYEVFEDTDVIVRSLTVRNTGADEPVTVRTMASADIRLPAAAARLSHTFGRWGAEPQLERVPLPEGRLEFDGRGGRTGHRAQPWFTVDDGTATEDAGETWSASLAWSGSWRLAVERLPDERLHAVLGMHDLDFAYVLAPEQELETPDVALLHADGGFGAASRRWHDHYRAHVLRSDEPRPVLYNSWEATTFDVTLDGQSALAERAARIGCELFVVDDGWFVGRHDDRAGLGDWRPDPDKLPGGLDPLIARVHELRMAFGLWVEPEMVNPDSDLYRAHPDWVYHFPTRPRTELRNQLVLNLGRDDVREFVWSTLHGLLSEHDIVFLKWDFNRPITDPGWPDEPHGNPQRLWVEHVRGLYGILERLRRVHPDVAVEACSGGGGRIDLGMIGHTDQVWISDNTDPYDRLSLQDGYAQAYPAATMVSWVTGSPSQRNGRSAPLSYRFHVSMTGVLGIGDDLTTWSEEDLAEAAALVAAYKEHRDLVCAGDRYRLGPVPEGVEALAYVAKDRSRAVVFAFGHGLRFGAARVRLRLPGLDPRTMYRVNGAEAYSGRLLAASGLDVTLSGDAASVLLSLAHQTR